MPRPKTKTKAPKKTPSRPAPGRRKDLKPSAKPLPPPVEPESSDSQPNGPRPAPQDGKENSSSFSTSSGPLSEESERLLGGITARIEDELPEPVEADSPEAKDQDGELAGLIGGYVFNQQDVHDTLMEFFDFLATRFDSEHWKLKERQARMLAEPGTQLINAGWQKIAQFLPEALQRWCETTPGLMAFILASGLIIVPRVKTQVMLSSKPKPKAPHAPTPIQQHPRVDPLAEQGADIFDGPGPYWKKV